MNAGVKSQLKQAGRTKPKVSARDYKLEADIQKSITDWLDLTGWQYSVTDASLSVFKDAAGKKHFRGAGKVQKSWADLTICLPVSLPELNIEIIGIMFAVEVKTPTGTYQPGQEEQLEKLNRAGALTLTARSLDDVIRFLNSSKYLPGMLRASALVSHSSEKRLEQLLSLGLPSK